MAKIADLRQKRIDALKEALRATIPFIREVGSVIDLASDTKPHQQRTDAMIERIEALLAEPDPLP